MFHRSSELFEKRRVVAWLCWSGWLYASAVSCAEGTPGNAERLSSLSSDQLRSLCTEVIDAWPAARDEQLKCDNGNTYYLDREGLSACGNQTTSCSARVGEWRECMRALAETPCETATPEPEQCTQLRLAPGCDGLSLPVVSQCTPPTPEQAAAWNGVYQFLDATRNPLGCDAEGAELPAQGFFALTTELVPAVPYSPLGDTRILAPLECESIEACRELAAKLAMASDPYAESSAAPNMTLLDSALCGPENSDTLRASEISGSGDEECQITIREQVLQLQTDGSLRIEIRSFEVPPPPKGEPCYLSDAVRGRCVSLEVLRAQRVAPLL